MYITLLFLTLFKHANSQFVESNFIISKYTCSDFSKKKNSIIKLAVAGFQQKISKLVNFRRLSEEV